MARIAPRETFSPPLTKKNGVRKAKATTRIRCCSVNVFDLHSQEWLDFISAFASIVLTFLAGLEVDPGYLRKRFAASAGIGLVSFVGPFVVGSVVAYGAAYADHGKTRG